MKKLIVGILFSIFLVSNTFAAPIMSNVADFRFINSQTNLTSKVYAGYGHGKIHDQSPNFNTEYFYEVKFDAAINCHHCRK